MELIELPISARESCAPEAAGSLADVSALHGQGAANVALPSRHRQTNALGARRWIEAPVGPFPLRQAATLVRMGQARRRRPG